MSTRAPTRTHSHAESRHKSWYYGKQECRRITNVFWYTYHWNNTNIFFAFSLTGKFYQSWTLVLLRCWEDTIQNLFVKSHGVTWAESFLTPPFSNSARFQVFSTETVQTELLERRGRSPGRGELLYLCKHCVILRAIPLGTFAYLQDQYRLNIMHIHHSGTTGQVSPSI
jgi:hypothetical protein